MKLTKFTPERLEELHQEAIKLWEELIVTGEKKPNWAKEKYMNGCPACSIGHLVKRPIDPWDGSNLVDCKYCPIKFFRDRVTEHNAPVGFPSCEIWNPSPFHEWLLTLLNNKEKNKTKEKAKEVLEIVKQPWEWLPEYENLYF